MRRQPWFVLALAALFGISIASDASAQARPQTVSALPGARIFVPNEVVIEVSGAPTTDAVDALARRHRLTRIESQYYRLTNSTMFRRSLWIRSESGYRYCPADTGVWQDAMALQGPPSFRATSTLQTRQDPNGLRLGASHSVGAFFP